MLNNFIYAETKELFLTALNNGEVLDEAIVFIADTKEIWNHGTYFAGELDEDGNPIIIGETNDNATFKDADNSTKGKCALNAGWESTIEGTATLVSGYQNVVRSSYSYAEGSNNYVCLRGAYMKFINSKNTNIYLTESKENRGVAGNWEEAESDEFISRLNFKAEDVISVITDDTLYENCAKITSVEGNKLNIEMLNGVTINRSISGDIGASRYCVVYCLNNPEAGIVELAKQSHVEGENNVIKGDDCHVEGRDNLVTAPNCHLEGRGNTSEGSYNHVEGRDNIAKGSYNHVEGRYNETTNAVEHAEGRYNKSNANTLHSVGVGSSSQRKNAHEITNDGKNYILGVGGYDGTNPTSTNDVASAFNKYLPLSGGTISGSLSINNGLRLGSSSSDAGKDCTKIYFGDEDFCWIGEGHTNSEIHDDRLSLYGSNGIYLYCSIDDEPMGIYIGDRVLRPSTTDGSVYDNFSIGENSWRFANGYFSKQIFAAQGFMEESDERLKNFEGRINVDLDKLANLKKNYFTWKDKDDTNRQLGVSAQEIKELYPEIVSETEDGILNVAYDKLSVVALAAIDQLHGENKELKNKINTLEERLAKLESLLEK